MSLSLLMTDHACGACPLCLHRVNLHAFSILFLGTVAMNVTVCDVHVTELYIIL